MLSGRKHTALSVRAEIAAVEKERDKRLEQSRLYHNNARTVERRDIRTAYRKRLKALVNLRDVLLYEELDAPLQEVADDEAI